MISFKRWRLFLLCLQLIICTAWLSSCEKIDLYERTVAIPKNEWSSRFAPAFSFEISDTASSYQVYIILRHDDRYNYNNIWLNLVAQGPDGKKVPFTQIEMPLADKEKGWLGSGMADLYEHRIPITLDPQKFSFNRKGTYRFTLAHMMREDPLQHVLNVGLRLERKAQ
jgi:gliding motility-associated lipoprotein GldH